MTYSRSIGAFQVIGGCANISALPNLTIAVYGYNLTLTPIQYVVQVIPYHHCIHSALSRFGLLSCTTVNLASTHTFDTTLHILSTLCGSRHTWLTLALQVAGSTCVLGIQPGAPDNTAVLGTAFMRAYFTAYTYNATSRSSYVSFAPGAPGNSTAASEIPACSSWWPGV